MDVKSQQTLAYFEGWQANRRFTPPSYFTLRAFTTSGCKSQGMCVLFSTRTFSCFECSCLWGMRLSIDAILLKTSDPYCWGIRKGAGSRCRVVPNLPGCDMIKALRAVQTCTSTSEISKMTIASWAPVFFFFWVVCRVWWRYGSEEHCGFDLYGSCVHNRSWLCPSIWHQYATLTLNFPSL